MSTVPTTPNPAQVTPPNPETMPLNDLRAQIANPPAPTAPEPTPAVPPAAVPAPAAPFEVVKSDAGVEIKLESGQVYKGKTEADAWAEVAKAQVAATRTIKDLNQKQAPQPDPAPQPAPQGFSPQAVAEKYAAVDLTKVSAADFNALYYAALATDVGEAQALANARSNGFRTVGEFYQAMGQMQQTTEQTFWRDLSVQFSAAAPDFPHTQEAANVLGEIMEQAGVSQPTVENMKMAWAYAKSEGKIKPLSAEEVAAQRAGSFSQPKPPVPPPTIPSNQPGVANADTMANLNSMPLADLKKLVLQGHANR